MNRGFSFLGLIVLLCRLVVGGIFLYASWDKFQHPDAFAQAIHNYRMVPYSLLHLFAYLLPATELIVGVTLILGIGQRGAALLAGLMTLVFIVAISLALTRGLDISCGCFHTDGGHSVGVTLLWRDALLLLLCLPPLLIRETGPALGPLLRR